MKKNEKIKRNKTIKWAIGIVGIICVIIVAILATNKDNSQISDPKDVVIAVYDKVRNESTVYFNGKNIDTIDGEAVVHSDMDCNTYYIESHNSVYFLDKEKLTKIEFDGDLQFLAVANHSSEALVANSKGGLYRLNKTKLDKITSEIVDYAVLSGDGKSYAYNVDADAYLGIQSSEEIKVDNVFVSYMSDDGELIYGFEYGKKQVDKFKEIYSKQNIGLNMDENYPETVVNYKLILMNKAGKTNVIAEKVRGFNGLNSSGTEIMYYTSSDTYVLADGKKTKKIIDEQIYPYEVLSKNNNEVARFSFRNIDSFVDCAIHCCNDLYLINEKYELTKVVNNCSYIIDIADDFSKMLYYDDTNERHTLCDIEIEEGAECTEIADEVEDVVMSSDGESIYYIKNDSIKDKSYLYYVDGWKSPRKVMEMNVPNYGTAFVKTGDAIYAGINEVYYLEGKNASKVEGLTNAISISYIGDKEHGEEYIVYDYALYNLDETKVKSMDGKYIDNLEELKKSTTSEEKVEHTEYLFEVNLPDNVELQDYEFIDEDTYSDSVIFTGDYMYARVILDESEYENIIEQYKGVQYDMMEYTGWSNCEAWNVDCKIESSDPQIKYWYQVKSEHKAGDKMARSDDEHMQLWDRAAGYNVLITEIKDGKFYIIFAANLKTALYA